MMKLIFNLSERNTWMILEHNKNSRSELFIKAINLKKIYKEKGYFNPSKSRITIEVIVVLLTLVSAFVLLSTQTTSSYLISPILFGIYLQQSAYIGHELGHVSLNFA